MLYIAISYPRICTCLLVIFFVLAKQVLSAFPQQKAQPKRPKTAAPTAGCIRLCRPVAMGNPQTQNWLSTLPWTVKTLLEFTNNRIEIIEGSGIYIGNNELIRLVRVLVASNLLECGILESVVIIFFNEPYPLGVPCWLRQANHNLFRTHIRIRFILISIRSTWINRIGAQIIWARKALYIQQSPFWRPPLQTWWLHNTISLQ